MSEGKKYQFETYDCLSDPVVCLLGYCCTPCVLSCIIAPAIGATDHQCKGFMNMCGSTMCWCPVLVCGLGGCIKTCCCGTFCCGCCGLCKCVPENIAPCWMSRLLEKSMAFHGITQFPEGCMGMCGDKTCCQGEVKFYWQLLCPCTSSCTLCVMHREVKAMKIGGGGATAAVQMGAKVAVTENDQIAR